MNRAIFKTKGQAGLLGKDENIATAFTLTTECIQKFIDTKCVKYVIKNDDNSDAETDTHEQAAEVLVAWKNRGRGINESFDISLLDEDKMMSHMLDCYAALCAAQQYRVQKKQPSKLDAKTQQAKNKVFKTAMSLISTGMIHDGSEKREFSSAFSKMITTSAFFPPVSVFPNDSKQTDGRGWMPLHWAALAFDTHEGDLHGLTEEDVHLMYASNPLALQRYHHFNEEDVEGQDVEGHCTTIQRYTPVHFLCMQPVTTKTTSLLRYFSICNRQAHFIPSVLHVTCQLGQPTEELLKFLLQLDSSQTAKRYGTGSDDEYNDCTPLGHLCYNKCCNEGLMTCLLDVDSSPEVVIDALFACTRSSDMLEQFDLLSKYRDWVVLQEQEELLLNRLLYSVLSQWPSLPSSLCIAVLQRLLAVRPNVIKEMHDGCLPVHVAAQHCDVDVMEFLLGEFPESAMIVTEHTHFPYHYRYNLLHLALIDPNQSTKIRYLCSRYPEMIHQITGHGTKPLHMAFGNRFTGVSTVSTAKHLCEVGGQELVRALVGYENSGFNGWSPLHFFMSSSLLCSSSPLSESADFFRLMLSWYPEAAGIMGVCPRFQTTPYQLAVKKKLDPYFLRLLLRAAPDLNPAELHRLNYAERRMAMFLAFRAAATVTKPLLMARLRFENKDLVKHVVSFL